jgi:hypothetical protein
MVCTVNVYVRVHRVFASLSMSMAMSIYMTMSMYMSVSMSDMAGNENEHSKIRMSDNGDKFHPGSDTMSVRYHSWQILDYMPANAECDDFD